MGWWFNHQPALFFFWEGTKHTRMVGFCVVGDDRRVVDAGLVKPAFFLEPWEVFLRLIY